MLSALRPEPGAHLPAGAGAGAEGVRAPRPAGHAGWRSPTRARRCPAYFSQAPATDDGPAPVMILCQRAGLHQGAHVLLRALGRAGRPRHLLPDGRPPRLRRGAAAAGPHRPGRHRGVGGGAASTTCETRDDVDPARIGLVGWSLGGYYAPRAAAFEKRLALVVAWGANHNWGAVQRRRLEREGERPVPHYWEHVLWVWGAATDLDDLHRLRRPGPPGRRGRADHRAVPDLPRRERPADPAGVRAPLLRPGGQLSPSASCGSSRPRRAATEHIGLDHLPYVSTFIADWVSDVFRSLPDAAPSATECRPEEPA